MKQIINTKWFVFLIQFSIIFTHSLIGTIKAKEYVIGVEDVSYYPLYDFSAELPNKASFTKELLSTFFNTQGYQFKFLPLPVKRFDKWYMEEAIDFKFPDNIRWREGDSKELNITYSEPVLRLMAGSFVLKKNKNIARKDITRLGTIFGFFPTLWYDRVQDNSLELVEVSSPYSIVKHMLRGNLQATNIDKNVIDYNLKLLGHQDDEIVLNEGIKHEDYAYHFSSIHHPHIIKEFNLFLKNNKQLVASIKAKYKVNEVLPK